MSTTRSAVRPRSSRRTRANVSARSLQARRPPRWPTSRPLEFRFASQRDGRHASRGCRHPQSSDRQLRPGKRDDHLDGAAGATSQNLPCARVAGDQERTAALSCQHDGQRARRELAVVRDGNGPRRVSHLQGELWRRRDELRRCRIDGALEYGGAFRIVGKLDDAWKSLTRAAEAVELLEVGERAGRPLLTRRPLHSGNPLLASRADDAPMERVLLHGTDARHADDAHVTLDVVHARVDHRWVIVSRVPLRETRETGEAADKEKSGQWRHKASSPDDVRSLHGAFPLAKSSHGRVSWRE